MPLVERNKLFFVVPGSPLPQERPFVTRRGTFDRPRSKKAKQYVATLARIAVVEQRWQCQNGPLSVALMFFGPHGASDIDNLSKLILDSLKGIAWDDDKQVIELWAKKFVKSKTTIPETLVFISKENL